jgi:mono/diheme cytochrome c family protein
MRLTASMLTLAALIVVTAGCVERKNTGAPLPPKGPDPTIFAKTNESPVEDANAPPGRRVFDTNKCAQCHSMDDAGLPGKGKGRAPNLAKVGAKRSVEWIAEHVRNPKAHGGKMKAYPESQINNADLKTLSEYLASLK